MINTKKTKLEKKFSFYYRVRENSTSRKIEEKKYQSQIKKIADFEFVEDFWGIFLHLRRLESFKSGIDIHLVIFYLMF